jgi:hypothetical protein
MKKYLIVLLITCIGLPLAGIAAALTTAVLPDVRQWMRGVMLSQNSHAPSAIKDIVVYTQGDGLVVYLTMVDDRGSLTRADGLLTVSIRQAERVVWMTTLSVSPGDFRVAQVGSGAFERTMLLYSLGRLDKQTLASAQRGKQLTIDVLFVTNTMEELRGTQTHWF